MGTAAATGADLASGSPAELLRAYGDQGDLEARERVITAYIPLVESLARRYSCRGEPLEDLVQVGAIGLIKAVDRFDPKRGVAFAAFAAPNIVGEIRRHLRDRSDPIRVPRRYQEVSVRLRGVRRELAARLQRDPTTAELAAAAEVEERELDETLRAEHARRPVSLADAAPSLSAEDVFRRSEDRLSVSRSMRSLHRHERHALRYRYYADMSQEEIAGRLGISQSQASRLIASALAKLRVELEEKSNVSPARALHSGHGDSRRRRGGPARGRSVKAPPAIVEL
jgi:RNA polymerase sigma-B factor